MASLSHPTYMQLSQQSVMVEPIHHQHIIRNDRHPFSTSDDNVITKQNQSIHAPDGREVIVTPILHLYEDIFENSTVGTILESNNQAHMDAFEDRNNIAGFRSMLATLAYTINKISCEIYCKCYGGDDAHAITLNFLNLLSSYSWDSKVVLTLEALAVNYGEFWLVAQIHQTNQLAKSIAILKHFPDILEHNDSLRPKFDFFRNLIKSMMDVTRPHTPIVVYWKMRSVVVCASQIVSLILFGHAYLALTIEAWELSSLGHKISNIYGHLTKQLPVCNQHIDDNRHAEAYQKLVRVFKTAHTDNLKILKALIYPKDDIMPLYDGSNKRRVTLDVIGRKNVLLLISNHEMPHEELSILEQMYRESRHQPIRLEGQYEELCGSLAFPFTSSREDALWKEETWRLKLLMDGIDPTILNWNGSENSLQRHEVAEATRIPLELVYLGKSNPRERLRKNIATISLLKLSYCWQDLTSIWFL
ncbi:hypothetical protein MKX01_040185 [Papaver californicum]|nr:hypothetical protein MKX01_040185 [Papaver californicum]